MYRFCRVSVLGLVMLGLLVCVMLVDCSNKIKGTERKNSPPSINFANVPPESTTFSITPQVYWNATDIDGYITKYQYVVIISSKIDSLWGSVDSAYRALERIRPSMWLDSLRHLDTAAVSISAKETVSSIVKVQLFAAAHSETDSIRQYLFVRAVDDDSAVSNVIHRMFSRNNHRPKTYINYTSFYSGNKVIAQYSLPETTYYWRGIKIAWEGSDSQDYKGAQPNFLYKWELYGPFADTNIQLDTTVLKASGRVVDVSLNESDSTPLVEDKNILLPMNKKCLVNYPHKVSDWTDPPPQGYSDNDNGYGWYLLIVWTMDDAFAFSSSLDTTANPHGHLWFKTIHPLFSYQPVKKILVLDLADYSGDVSTQGGEMHGGLVRDFYYRARDFLVDENLCDTFTFTTNTLDFVNKDTLSRYNLLIYLNESKPQDCLTIVPGFEDYLKVGGKVWAIGNGVRTFGYDPNGLGDFWNQFVDFTLISTSVPADFAMNYFGLLGMRSIWWAGNAPNFRSEEFIEARDNKHTLYLPDLKMDPDKVANQVNWDTYGSHAPKVPWVCYTALGYAGRIYTFISADSTTSSFHLKPCGSVYESPLGPDGRNPIFKTAHMGFPLHLMQEGTDGAIRDSLFKGMVEWFWKVKD